MLDFRLETFLKVCEFMNFTLAAQELSITQPAVSQHIKYLEEKYNTRLFIRKKKNIYLSGSGKILLAYLKTMKNDDKKLNKLIQENEKGKIKIIFGVTLTIGEYIILPALVRFIKLNNEVNFEILCENTKTLLKYLDEGIIDFAIVEGHIKAKNYDTKKLKSEDYIGVCAKKHKFNKNIDSISDLLGERLIIREEGSGTLAMFTNMLSMQNISISDFDNVIQINNMHMVVELLKNDCGISFLYKSAVQKELEEGKLVEIKLKDFKIKHDLTFIWNKGSAFSEEYLKIFEGLKIHYS